MQEFSQRVCQYVEAFENEQKKKYKMSLQKTEASAGTAHILFEERVNFNLCFTCLKWQLLFHCFHFFRQSFLCTIPRFAHSLFNVGLLLSSLGSSEGAPPPLRSCFWLFIRISSRVESSCCCSKPLILKERSSHWLWCRLFFVLLEIAAG